jgi:hypothetical protein
MTTAERMEKVAASIARATEALGVLAKATAGPGPETLSDATVAEEDADPLADESAALASLSRAAIRSGPGSSAPGSGATARPAMTSSASSARS